MLGIFGTTPLWKKFLFKFQKQAKTGKVPPGFPSGHEDGWGIAYSFSGSGTIKFADRSSGSAFNSERYTRAIGKIGQVPSVVLAHLRKASKGINVVERNSHPFIQNNWAFMHNGTFYNVEKLPIDSNLKFTSDNSDTEHLFFFMLSTFIKEENFQKAWQDFVEAMENNQYSFSAVNCIFSNGREMYAIRWAEESPDYYTLYSYQLDNNCVIITSEPLEDQMLQKEKWISIPNKAVVKLSEGEPAFQLLDKDGKTIHLGL
ncbi:MAG: class II glutamine amidotransferase [Candidatus Hodarchaeales archaeon]